MNSGLSNTLYRGVADTVPFFSLSDLFMLLRRALSRPGRMLLAVYWPTTDTLAHVYGPNSPAFSVEVTILFQLLVKLFLARVKNAVVVATSDHGFREINPKRDVIFCPDQPELKEGLLFPPVGDMRAAYLFLRRGHEKNVRDFFAQSFPEDFLVLTPEEALARSLWGLESASPEIRARLGDLIAVAIGGKVIVWEKEFKLRGMHGGLTQDELLVPFLAKAL